MVFPVTVPWEGREPTAGVSTGEMAVGGRLLDWLLVKYSNILWMRYTTEILALHLRKDNLIPHHLPGHPPQDARAKDTWGFICSQCKQPIDLRAQGQHLEARAAELEEQRELKLFQR